MQLYNTLTRKKEDFIPVSEGKVGMYTCGITAYDYCHIGHARSSIVFDTLVRYLQSLGQDVTFIRNFTDVDDKIITRANKEGVTSEQIASKYIDAFHEDMDRLGVQRANIEPKATEHIDDMIRLCSSLIEQGHAYATQSGDVYFRVRSYPEYGKLSGRDIDDLRSGARIAIGEEKEDPLDFALWKAAKPGEPSWTSPWGQGRPGWHIECSAMIEHYLPLPLDIHGGGQDLIFPHHENEIAQTEASTQKPFSRFWMHNGFVQLNAEKMSKSLGNFKTIREILEITEPEVLRMFLLARHYRSPIDYSVEALDETEKNLKRLYETLQNITTLLLTPAPQNGTVTEAIKDGQLQLEEAKTEWVNAMADDMNTAAALGHINVVLHLANRIMDDKSLKKNIFARQLLEEIKKAISTWSDVLGVLHQEPNTFLKALKKTRAKRKNIDIDKVESLIEQRATARAQKDFAASDAARDTLLTMGIEVRDTPEGAVWDIA